jgi:hypothetical protein
MGWYTFCKVCNDAEVGVGKSEVRTKSGVEELRYSLLCGKNKSENKKTTLSS